MSTVVRSLVLVIVGMALTFSCPAQAAAPVKVDAATPSSGEQGTIDLDVVITGSGFEPDAAVDFLVTGSDTDTGNIVVNQVIFNDSRKLTAKVSLTNAKIADFDIKVRLMSGRNGKGISLFQVVAKSARSGDSTPPDTIGAIDVKTSGLALTLRFVAPGDDGMSGNASGYDVFYRTGTLCSDSDNPGTSPDTNLAWTRAERSVETIPEPVGSLEFFNVRPLVSGMDYCLAVRVRDEVPNWSGWRVVGGMTEPDWSLSQTWSVSPLGASAEKLSLVLTKGEPVAAWAPDNHTVVFAGDGWQKPVSFSVPSGSFVSPQVRAAGNPDPNASPNDVTASAVVTNTYTSGTGRKATLYNRFLLIEGGPSPFTPRVSTIATGARLTGGLDEPLYGGSTISYVLRDGVWNPVVTLERIEAKSSSTKRTSLTIAERIGQTWQETPVLTREGADQRYGFFEYAEVLTKPDGTTLAFVAPLCGITVYGEHSSTGWSYWDAGPALTRYRAGFDSQGDVVISGQTGYGAVNPVVLRYGDFVALGGKPAATCDLVVPQAGPGEVVQVAPDPDLSWLFTSGVAASNGATFLSAALQDGNTKTVEQRVLYTCGGTDTWHVLTADRTNKSTNAEPVLNSAGEILRAYRWGYFARAIAVGPAYTTTVPDAVYVSTTSANLCM
jgi:hypothetical protein